jgi:endonuclease V
MPTIGVGKSFYEIDGLTISNVKQRIRSSIDPILWLCGDSGTIWGAAFRTNPKASNPVYISVGHRVSLPTALVLTRHCSRYRVPEPIRQADQLSKEALHLYK